MIEGISSALSGLRAGSARFDIIASNLANLSTAGYRNRRVDFRTGPGGRGVVVVSTSLSTTPGVLRPTGNGFDAAIQGDSFFEVRTPDGRSLFSRNGSFRVDSEGFFVDSNGNRFQPEIQIPSGTQDVSVTRSGEILGTVGGQETVLGRLRSVRFQNPAGLGSLGGGLYEPTEVSGEPVRGNFTQPGFGELIPGAVEGSNTDAAGGLVDLLLTQRFIQFQTATIRVSDDLLEEAVNLGRPRRSD